MRPSIVIFKSEWGNRIITQAERIFKKFGGASRLALLIKTAGFDINTASVYKWNYPRERGGSDGRIPTANWPMIMKAARLDGIIITSEDIDPRPEPVKLIKSKTLKE
jgi:hypothetical protein